MEPETLQQLNGRKHMLQLEQEILTTEVPSSRLEQVNQEIIELQSAIEEQRLFWKFCEATSTKVDRKSVAQVVADWTGVPLAIILKEQGEYTYATLMAAFQEKIVGQRQALDKIAKQVINYRAGLIDPCKPMGVFLLVGPSGVGKTETAQVLSEILTGKSTSLLRFNMTEFQESHSVSTLKGSPPGYIGHGKGGTLTEAVRRNPYSVILLDEVDKAHREVMDIFYQVFDKGILEDSEGVEVDFTNTLILMTANLGSESIDRPEDLKAILTRHFRTALLSRMTVVPYMPLQESEIRQIVRLKLQAIRERILTHYGREFAFNEEAITFVVERVQTDFIAGARAIDYWINQELLPELSSFLLQQPKDSAISQHIFLRIDAKKIMIQATSGHCEEKDDSGEKYYPMYSGRVGREPRHS
jgi:type VI secretion system protein VasG